MAKLQVTTQNKRKYTVVGLLLVTVLAGIAAIVIGTQLDRNLAGRDSDASLPECATLQGPSCTSNDLDNFRCEGRNLLDCNEIKCREANGAETSVFKYVTYESCPSSEICIILSGGGLDCVPDTANDCDSVRTQADITRLNCSSNCSLNDNSTLRCGTGANASFRINCVQLLTNYFRIQFVSDSRCPIQTGGGGEQPTNPNPTNPPTQGSTTSTTSACSGTDRVNGCQCSRADQCISGFCNSAGQCARPESCTGPNRPNGCQCGNSGQCSSGNCQLGNDGVNRCRPTTGCGANPDGRVLGCYCVNNGQCASGLCETNTRTCIGTGGATGGGGVLPRTGLFDEDSRALLIGLILIGIGFLVKYLASTKKLNIKSNAISEENLYNDIDKDIARIINSQAKRKK